MHLLLDYVLDVASKWEVKVCRLNKSLYGLKQVSREWFDKLTNAILEQVLSNPNQITHYLQE